MKLLVAVSGGVDSVVLLDMLINASELGTDVISESSYRPGESRAPFLESPEAVAWAHDSSMTSVPHRRQPVVGGTRRTPSFSGRDEFWSLLPKRGGGQSPPSKNALVVAHFEHGIRGEESLEDQKFVKNLADKYGLEFVTTNAHLGVNVSEAEARAARYTFLRREAKQRGAMIVTAHHADDLVETVAINLTRGTGWRGVAVLDSDVVRPLLGMTKREIIMYAHQSHLEWREDSTNMTDAYLRNRIRKSLAATSDDVKWQVCALRAQQITLKREIDAILADYVAGRTYIDRQRFTTIGPVVADELIRAWCISRFGVAPARPARSRIFEAIATYQPGKVHQSTDGIDILVGKDTVSLALRSA
ncbi:MAG TPA: tRNA lysidine(34) synthetase TilS [Candidatus Saccharimonadaceae bacterium]|nr:tRNA lysidine(34) synthetase TilS [Candidatus Saccharimonadaceae bacterium]